MAIAEHEKYLTACHDCDVLQSIGKVPIGSAARCVNCGAKLFVHHKGGPDLPLAIMLVCMVLFVIATSFPLLTLDMGGRSETVSLPDASLALYREGMPMLAAIVFFTTILGPALVILSSLYVFYALRWRFRLPGMRIILRGFSYLPPWGMMDVFMLGVLVAMVKLADMADLYVGIGFYAFAILSVAFGAAAVNIDIRVLWARYARIDGADHAR